MPAGQAKSLRRIATSTDCRPKSTAPPAAKITTLKPASCGNAVMRGISHFIAKVGSHDTTKSRLLPPCKRPSTSSNPANASPQAACNCRPAGDSRSRRPSFNHKAVPKCASNSFSCLLTAPWVTCKASAAAVRLPCLAVKKKNFSALSGSRLICSKISPLY